MKILATGGTVFVSRFTAEYFVKEGHEVYVLNRGSRAQSDGVKLICADRHDLGDALKCHDFDLVVDVTSYNEVDVNDLLDGLGNFGCYVMISSSAVYPETLPQPFKEDMALGENIHWGDYGTNKIAAEKTLLSRVPEAYILRPPYLCGKMNNLYREAFVFECAETDRAFCIPDHELKMQFFDVEDMCRLISVICEKRPDSHIINVGNSASVTAKEWVAACYAAVGKTPVFRTIPDDIEVKTYFPFRDYEYALDVTRQNGLLPETKPLEQSMRESYEWWKDHRELIVRKNFFEVIDGIILISNRTLDISIKN